MARCLLNLTQRNSRSLTQLQCSMPFLPRQIKCYCCSSQIFPVRYIFSRPLNPITRKIHTSSNASNSSGDIGDYLKGIAQNDVPDYLKEIANTVLNSQEDVLDDDVEQEYEMQDQIMDFLLSRAIFYEELESSFIAICPSCGHSNKTHDMFIDKNSGYSVCPWCCWDGNWEDLVKLYDSKEDCLTQEQLNNFLLFVKPLKDSQMPLISSQALMNINISQLNALGCGITEDQSQIILPFKNEKGENIGFASISLLHPQPKVVRRLLEHKSAIFTGLPVSEVGKKYNQRVIVVSDVLDVLHLNKLNIPAVAIISDPKPNELQWVFKNYNNIVLWLQSRTVSRGLTSYIASGNISCFAVKSPEEKAISSMAERRIFELLEDTIPVLSGSVRNILIPDLGSRLFERVINKDEVNGVKWKRFQELNHFLLGHREGELTVFTGLTGSGKTTFMSEYSLDLCLQGVCTLWGSFEVSVPRLCEIMMQQYSGEALPENLAKFKQLFYKFSELPLTFIDTHGQLPLEDVIRQMTEAVLLNGVRHVVIDNLQFMLGVHGACTDWWVEQDKAVKAFRQFATMYNCHVTLIVHPRKLLLGEKLNLQSISGGARVTQEADNVLILHVSQNKDGSTNNLGPKTLQVVKNRYGGTLGEIKLRFHKQSLTLSSTFGTKKPTATTVTSVQNESRSTTTTGPVRSFNKFWE